MKLINLNIGIKIDNSKSVAKFIKQHDPEIVTFQEVIRHFDKSVHKIYKSKSRIEKIIGKKLSYSFFGPLYTTKLFKKNEKITTNFGGLIEQGNETKSKFPIITATNDHYYKKYSFDLDKTNFIDHSRALQIVELNINKQKMQHMNRKGCQTRDKKDTEITINQCKYILESAKRKNIPTIIAGDFNLLPNTKSIKILNKEFRNLIEEYNITHTRPDIHDEYDDGSNTVYYIFVNSQIKVKDFQVIETNISDHFPLILDFEIKS